MRKSTTGFTIVELLIVIVVIAILAAISVVAYTGIQNRANDSAIQSDLANIAKKLEVFKITVSTIDYYPSSLTASGLDVSVSKNAYGNHYTPSGSSGYNLLYCRMADGQSFALAARSKSGTTFAITNAKSVYVSSQVLTSGTSQCPAEGMSGAPAVWTFSNGVWAL